MNRQRLWAAVAVAAFVVCVAALAVKSRPAPRAELLAYQALISRSSVAEQERFAQLHRALNGALKARANEKRWPAHFDTDPGITWVLRQHGLYVNYVGIPADASRLRWLVLIIEPDPKALKDAPAPEDEEHRTLADGTALHVTVWTSVGSELPQEVLPFPAAEDWTQQLGG
jgi:hypothetical protein